MKLELFWPVSPVYINQSFGESPDYYKKYGILGHNGIDFMATHGQIVRAAHDGIVTFAGEDGSGGWGVVIRTEDEREYETGKQALIKSIYWHFIPAIPVKAGQKVSCGDVLGFADNTGDSTGDHLHFGIKPVKRGEQEWQFDNIEQANGYHGAIDPFPFFGKVTAEKYKGILAQLDLIKQTLAKLFELLKGRKT